jgi:hypothetical protein
MGKQVPKTPKYPQIFHQKREAPFLFYKFYKFRGNLPFNFNVLSGYKLHMGTYKLHMGTYKLHMGTKLAIEELH